MITNAIRMSDAEVREGVLRELRLDSRLKSAKVDVSVREGFVTLAGTVADSSELLAACESAERSPGVYELSSQLRLAPFGGRPRTDADIAEAVRGALHWDTQIPHETIQVAVSNGWVALHGRVGRLRDRENVERLVRRLEGVRGVYNLVTVEPDGARDEDVRDRIEEALRQRARREADSIGVEFRGGTLSLTGRLQTWGEKQAVIGALAHAPGVRRIEDRLSIDPYL